MKLRFASVLVISGFAVASLTGCGGGAGGEQSVADACTQARDTVASVAAEMQTLGTDAASGNFSSVVDGIQKLAGSIGEAENKVTNAEVKSALGDLNVAVENFASVFEGVEDGDLAGLTNRMTELTETSEEIDAAGTRLDEICG